MAQSCFPKSAKSPHHFSTKNEPKYIITSEWLHFKNCWKSGPKVPTLRDQSPMAKGPLDHVVLSVNFMTIITEDKKVSFIYKEKWNFCSFTIKKKNDSLHFCNEEHEMQWKCKFASQHLFYLAKSTSTVVRSGLSSRYINICIFDTSYHWTKISPVVPNLGAIYNTQGCRELIRFSIYH